jgi:class 3 adenylate cyclase
VIEAETRYVIAPDGVHIAYQVTGRPSGQDTIDLVMMHGTTSHLEIAWEDPKLRRLYERLGSFARLIRFDRRGMGMSDGLRDLPTFEQQVGDWAVVMDAAGVERGALFGTTDAGLLAISFAADHPERVTRLVAFESAPRLAPRPGDDYGVNLDAMDRIADASRRIDLDAQLSIVAPGRKDEPGFPAWFRRYNRSASGGVSVGMFVRSQMDWDVVDRLPEVDAPTLIMHRTGNTVLPLRSSRAWAEALPDARLVELEGTGTAIYADDVDPVADEIEAFLTGTRPPPRRDRVLATVLFTDIVDSTKRAAALGDASWRELLDRHHRVLREQLTLHGGREMHTAGDGFLATFDGPRRAIACARAAQVALRPIDLEIRAGVHTGEVEMTDDDVQGIAVHIGARVAALATGGEVLVSSTVRELVVGSGIEFEDRGSHELKGVPGEWHVFALVD